MCGWDGCLVVVLLNVDWLGLCCVVGEELINFAKKEGCNTHPATI